MMDVYDWDTGKYLGKIEQAHQTYNVIGNMNEHQVAIGETTYGGLASLQHQPSAIVDYGSLMYLALQRSKSAREAIKVMTSLVAKYGYYSEGEDFSISDKNEAWILEMIGKGEGEKGAVWVARRIPDGYVSGHANHARITTFPLANGKTSITSKDMDKIFNKDVSTVYAADVISFAREKGFFSGKSTARNTSTKEQPPHSKQDLLLWHNRGAGFPMPLAASTGGALTMLQEPFICPFILLLPKSLRISE